MKRPAGSLSPVMAVDRRGRRPLHRQVYEGFRAAILEGRLAPGQRLPSTRTLARELGVSRIPVVTAFEQLAAEGYVTSRVGAGSFVAAAMRELPPVSPSPSRAGPRRIPGPPPTPAPPWNAIHGPFRLSQPDFDAFPVAAWARLLGRRTRGLTRAQMAYGDPMGHLPLREALAAHLRTVRSVRCTAAQVMIVSGSQQALALIGHALLPPGASFWMEEPGYSGARDGLRLAGARPIPVPVDVEGLDVEAGIAAAPDAGAAYVTPSHQYPLGVVMSAPRRLRLLEWARRRGAWIVEDDYDSEYRYDSQPIASLQGLDDDRRVIYVGTFSKVLFPALRVGYLILPEDLVPRFAEVRQALDIFPSVLQQAPLCDFLREGHYAHHVRRTSAIYAERRRVLAAAIERELGDAVEVIGGHAGMHLTLLLPRRARDLDLALEAARRGLSVQPLSSCYAGRPRAGLVLGYGTARARDLPDAVRRLALLVRR